jgi:hypothetical protein
VAGRLLLGDTVSVVADLGGTLAGGGLALVGALGGVLITQRYVARESRASRAEQRRTELRTVLATLTVECRALVSNSYFLIPAFTTMSDAGIKEFMETESGNEMARRQSAINQALSTLRYSVGNAELKGAIAQLERLLGEIPEKANGPALSVRGGSVTRTDAVSSGFHHLRLVSAALEGVQSAAYPLLQVNIPPEIAARNWHGRRTS